MESGAIAEPADLLIRLHPRDDARHYEKYAGRPHVVVEKPFRQTATRSGDGMDIDFMAENTRHLADTLHHSDVVLNVASTIAIEASIFDTPVINIGFDGQPGSNQALMEWHYGSTHFQKVVRSGAVRIAQSNGEMIDLINMYLAVAGDRRRRPPAHRRGAVRVHRRPIGRASGGRDCSRAELFPGRDAVMDIEAHRDLQLLEAVEQNARVTQRTLSTKLGIALGLTNIYLKRLVRKGYIKCVNVQSNRISYLITPRGIVEKARLTYEFMDYSLHLYADVRRRLRTVFQECAAGGRRVAIFGRGEAAELAYLSLKEAGLEPVAIFDGEGGPEFLGMPVRAIRDHAEIEYDLIIVATLERSAQQLRDGAARRRSAARQAHLRSGRSRRRRGRRPTRLAAATDITRNKAEDKTWR